MSVILETLQKSIIIKEVNEDNFLAKLFHKATFAFLLLGAALVVANTYIGDPIQCDKPTGHTIDMGLLTTSCWIHGSYHLNENFTSKASGELTAFCVRKPDQENVLTDDKLSRGTDTAYYQWVPFMLVINAIIFIIPHQLWKSLSGGYLKKFCNKSTMNRDAETKNEHFRDLARYHADFFHERRDQNRLYLIKFLTYEFLNLIALIIVFVMTDKFLGNYFHSYGAEVISDALKEDGVKINHYDAKCNAFPTLVSCLFMKPGVTGKGDRISTMCILSQNIINEKIYLFLWFWYVLLFTLSALLIVYRLALFFVPGLRMTLMQLKFKRNAFIKVTTFMRDCDIWDWFLLYQIADNVDSYFLEQFVLELKTKSDGFKTDDESDNLLEKGGEDGAIPMKEC